MKIMKRNKGFTLIEILLVVTIIGIMLAVIVPRAWRANIDAKYGLVRQAGSELASFANEWAEQQIDAQESQTSTATLNSYLITLCNTGGTANWVGGPTTNWNNQAAPASVTGRNGASNDAPEANVQDIVPPEKMPINPFNGATYFFPSNFPTSARPVPGALGGAYVNEADTADFNYFALIFLGTDSTSDTDFHAGMGTALANLRNGVFVGRTR